MTTYAYDTSTRRLLAVWHTGIGATAHPVAQLHADTRESVGLHLAEALTRMSSSIWSSYTSPDLIDLPATAARRALRRPHLPVDGLLRVEEHPVVEGANGVGRQLAEVGSAGVTRAVIADVEEEIAAAGNAERGDLSGRARQAVVLTRVEPSPVQIAVADGLLREVPMGSPRLYTEVEPSAAAVAAVHWFLAAVSVVERLTGTAGTDLLEHAEREQPFDPVVAEFVLDALGSELVDRTPLGLTRSLLRSAVLAARGMLVTTDHRVGDEPLFTVLDPARPARCLLDGLVGAIQALAALHAVHLDPTRDDAEWMHLARAQFDASVREEAAARAPERMAELVPSASCPRRG
jgi:hypothetical protein